jgi:hypothetical protein
MENSALVCPQCNKKIEFERPLFCPFCGKKIDPTRGLELDDGEIKIYRFSQVAPFLMKLLLLWLALVFPVSWVFGRSGVVVGTVLYIVVSLVIFLVSLFVQK